MRRYHRTLACLSLLATAACTADSVTGPQAAPRHLTGAEIVDVREVRGRESAVQGRVASDVILITTTRVGTSSAP